MLSTVIVIAFTASGLVFAVAFAALARRCVAQASEVELV